MSTEMDAPAPAPAAGGKGAGKGGRSGKGGERRPGPIGRTTTFYREVRAELSKVIAPSRTELVTYVTVVLFFVTFMVALVSGLDYVLTKGVIALFG